MGETVRTHRRNKTLSTLAFPFSTGHQFEPLICEHWSGFCVFSTLSCYRPHEFCCLLVQLILSVGFMLVPQRKLIHREYTASQQERNRWGTAKGAKKGKGCPAFVSSLIANRGGKEPVLTEPQNSENTHRLCELQTSCQKLPSRVRGRTVPKQQAASRAIPRPHLPGFIESALYFPHPCSCIYTGITQPTHNSKSFSRSSSNNATCYVRSTTTCSLNGFGP